MAEKNNKKVIRAWCFYDWANSVFALTITTAIFPDYFYGIVPDQVSSIFGDIPKGALYSYAVAFSFLLVAFLNPFLSAIADVKGNKKAFMKFFSYLGGLSCVGLFFFDSPERTWLGTLLFVLGGIGFAGSLVFYNAFLPEIATEDKYDEYSARGYALGYIGSVVLLIVNLVMVMVFANATTGEAVCQDLGLCVFESAGEACRWSFLTVGLWWIGFAQITFRGVPETVIEVKKKVNIISHSINGFKGVFKQLKSLAYLKYYLMAFFVYSVGVQTIMYMATIFGKEVVQMETADQIILVLILQLVAILGAYVASKISAKKGNIFTLQLMLVIWVGVGIGAYFLGAGMISQFYVLGFFVGFVMGGVQSMSRSTYSKLIPQDTSDNTSYFSFYETLEKVSIAIGSVLFGLIRQLTGSMNMSALLLTIFFVVGLLILMKVPSKHIYNIKLNNDEE